MSHLSYGNATLVGNWYEDRIHRKPAEEVKVTAPAAGHRRGRRAAPCRKCRAAHLPPPLVRCVQSHLDRYRATPIAMAGGDAEVHRSQSASAFVRPAHPMVPAVHSLCHTAAAHRAVQTGTVGEGGEEPTEQRRSAPLHTPPPTSCPAVLHRLSPLLCPPLLYLRPLALPLLRCSVPPSSSSSPSLSLTSHSAYGGLYADTAAARNLLPLSDWDTKEATARATVASTASSPLLPPPSSASTGKACSGASGERLRVGGDVDPSSHSFVQHSWLPDRRHFVHYTAERVDVWQQTATREAEKANQATLEQQRRPSQPLPADDTFDRRKHSFNSAPAFKPLYH